MRTILAVIMLCGMAAAQYAVPMTTGAHVGGAPATPAATPTASPDTGTYLGVQSVTLASSTTGAYICYTLDGTTPAVDGVGGCSAGTLYSSAVSTPGKGATLKAVAGASGYSASGVKTATYTTNLLAAWKMTEGSGTSVADASGNSNTMTLGSADSWTTTGLPSGVTAAVVLPGANSNSIATIANSTPLNFEKTQAFSVSARFKITATVSGGGAVITHFNTGTNFGGWEMGEYFDGTCNRVWLVLSTTWNTSAVQALSNCTNPLTTNTWYTVTMTYSGNGSVTGVKIYLNGSSITVGNSSNTTLGSIQNAVAIRIGGRNDGTSLAKIQVADMNVYGRELTSAEASTLSSTPYAPAP